MTADHSPLPWERHGCACVDVHGLVTANTTALTLQEARANAALVCRAVNNHEALVSALRGILEIGKRDMSNPKYDGYFESAREALAKAEGNQRRVEMR